MWIACPGVCSQGRLWRPGDVCASVKSNSGESDVAVSSTRPLRPALPGRPAPPRDRHARAARRAAPARRRRHRGRDAGARHSAQPRHRGAVPAAHARPSQRRPPRRRPDHVPAPLGPARRDRRRLRPGDRAAGPRAAQPVANRSIAVVAGSAEAWFMTPASWMRGLASGQLAVHRGLAGSIANIDGDLQGKHQAAWLALVVQALHRRHLATVVPGRGDVPVASGGSCGKGSDGS